MRAFSNELRTAKRTVRISILLAMVLIALGINEIGSEQTRSFGRGISGALRELLYAYFGSAGLCFMWVVMATIPLLFARLIWRHTPRVPSDRWYHP